ncbi:MAG: hypothetical protein K1X55_07185 [Chitinophagales bacterium]|nr:hypothetical protein [Chitinophagales bacterium]
MKHHLPRVYLTVLMVLLYFGVGIYFLFFYPTSGYSIQKIFGVIVILYGCMRAYNLYLQLKENVNPYNDTSER